MLKYDQPFLAVKYLRFAFQSPDKETIYNIYFKLNTVPHFFAVPPVIKDKEQVTNVSVLVNQPTSLFCEVEGTPSPIVMWYKDDVQVNGDAQICVHHCLCL